MSEAVSVEQILTQAREKEREYGWLGAAESYQKALGLVSERDFQKTGEIHERLGYASNRAAMQAESADEFEDRMRQAVANYEKAGELYGRASERKAPWMLRCDAMTAYAGFWLIDDVPEKKRLLDECWRLTKEALKAFDEAADALEYGKTYNQLSSSAFHKGVLELDFQALERVFREAMECGERAIALLLNVGVAHELARAYVKTALYTCVFAFYCVPDMDEKYKHFQKGVEYWKKANELSEEAALLELLTLPEEAVVWKIEEILVHYEKALGLAKKTRDKLLIGDALDMLAYGTYWKAYGTEDPEKRLATAQKALQYAEEAKRLFSPFSYVSSRSGVLWTGAPYAEYYWNLAFEETDLKKRRELFEKAVMNGTQAIKLAESTGYPAIIGYAHHILGKALVSLAQTETNPEEKRRLLERALEHRNESVRIHEQFSPFSYWNRGVMWNYLAELKAQLSDFERDSESRKRLLEEAVSNKENCLELCVKENAYWEKAGELTYFAALGAYQYTCGEMLNSLYGLTNNPEHQKKAIKAFEDSADSAQKLNLFNYAAQSYWKAAKGYNALGEHLKAAESFNLASSFYKKAAEKIPQLKDFYQDHAVYMQAWSEIEKARHHHVRQEYGSAEEHYEKAAAMHKSLKKWSYLAPNYSAWAQVENAEDLSRREQSEEALQAFEQAAKLFTETKMSLQTELDKIEDPDEKQMATNLLKATDQRRHYCMGRIALEEAKIQDKKGDHYSSSEKYASATETFEKIIEALKSEQDRREFRLIALLSQAWQKTTRAEAEASPELYTEASQLFEQAKELSPNERAKMLALGHSRFCRALEAGTRFADTGDAALHTAAIQHLESAAKYYVKAEFQSASEYAKATGLLFDAYVHMGNAKKEGDPEKKAKLYAMAERVLQTSAGSFMRAEHPEKREQVLRLLEKVKEERELALSLSEMLHAPAIVSTTSSFVTPAPTHEEAVGLERFEHADVQATVITRQTSLKVGENLALEIELVNAGKGPALLIKLAEVIPEGFEVTEKPEVYRVEDSYLNMKGKRLDPLKTEEVKLVLKPKVQGTFPLKPRILYLDENGKYKAHEPEPVTITVKELGISGWLKGPEKTKQH